MGLSVDPMESAVGESPHCGCNRAVSRRCNWYSRLLSDDERDKLFLFKNQDQNQKPKIKSKIENWNQNPKILEAKDNTTVKA